MRNHRGDGGEYRFRIELLTSRGMDVIYSHDRSSAIGFVDARWSEDSASIGLLVCNDFSGPILISYDVGRRESLPASTFQTPLKEHIKREYSLGPEVDALHWACSSSGRAAYREKNPEQ